MNNQVSKQNRSKINTTPQNLLHHMRQTTPGGQRPIERQKNDNKKYQCSIICIDIFFNHKNIKINLNLNLKI